ncbi:hypothetical protein CSHISOI_08413 [Colletotrichum shisoi]|uniref:Uncharacterized protein n=1 Tax=Colletotrichum shisoi TaxID=2078593 RepID=A0A5Q4BJU9_9PEZI|nr:hypothetical protein CSHISOI_08413 [Colletotrichum shisoi]
MPVIPGSRVVAGTWQKEKATPPPPPTLDSFFFYSAFIIISRKTQANIIPKTRQTPAHTDTHTHTHPLSCLKDQDDAVVARGNDPLPRLALHETQDAAALAVAAVSPPLLHQAGVLRAQVPPPHDAVHAARRQQPRVPDELDLDDAELLVRAGKTPPHGEAPARVEHGHAPVHGPGRQQRRHLARAAAHRRREAQRLDAVRRRLQRREDLPARRHVRARLALALAAAPARLRAAREPRQADDADGAARAADGDEGALGVDGDAVQPALDLEALVVARQGHRRLAVAVDEALGRRLAPDVPHVQARVLGDGAQQVAVGRPGAGGDGRLVQPVGLDELQGVGRVASRRVGDVDGVDPDRVVAGAEGDGVGVARRGAGGDPVDLGHLLGLGDELDLHGGGLGGRGVDAHGVDAQAAVHAAGDEEVAVRLGEGDGIDRVGVAVDGVDALEAGALLLRVVARVGGGQDGARGGGGGGQEVALSWGVVGVALGAAGGNQGRVDGVLGDGEDGVLVEVEVGDRVVLEVDLLVAVVFVVRVHRHVLVVDVDLLADLVGLEHLGLRLMAVIVGDVGVVVLVGGGHFRL